MFQKVKRIIGCVLLVCFLSGVFYVGFVRITDKSPWIFGFSLLRVSSDSMEPELANGEIIILQKTAPETLEKGDVISYKCQKGYLKGKNVTHQISKDPYEIDGVYYFTTRSLKPEAVNDPEITHNQIIGEVIYKIPFAGTLFDFFTQWYGIVAFLILLFIVFSSELIALFRKITRKDEVEDDSEHRNSEDIRQSEIAMAKRLSEFDGIITNLDDPDL